MTTQDPTPPLDVQLRSRTLMALGPVAMKLFYAAPFRVTKRLAARAERYDIPAWLENAVLYQVYPQSYQDSDGDGVGDLAGLVSRLDYIESLGVDAIWLNPVFDSPFADAGYDIRDFRKVAPRYGSNADLERLFREARERGMRVVLDLVAGHSSDEHAWFESSSRSDAGEHADYYIWTNTKLIPEFGMMVRSKHRRAGYYRKNFFDCQPALNYGYGLRLPFAKWEQPIDAPGPAAVRQELKDIIAYWMERGASGFRVDLAQSLVKRDFGYAKTVEVWRDIRDWFEARWPDGVLISEWGCPEASIHSGFHVDFALPWTMPGAAAMIFNEGGTYPGGSRAYFDARGRGSAHTFLRSFLAQREATRAHGVISIPTANHDFQRPNCGPRRTVDELKALMLYHLTFSDLPTLYYGDEIGMRHLEGLPDREGSVLLGRFNRAGARTPMQWDDSKNRGFSTAATADLYLPVDESETAPSVAQQADDDTSLLALTKALIAIKKRSSAFTRRAELKVLSGDGRGEYPLVYTRTFGDERWLVVINPTGRSCEVPLTEVAGVESAKRELGHGVCIADGAIHAQPVSHALYRLH